MFKHFLLLFMLLISMACGNKATMETALVQQSTLHLETLQDDTDLAVFLKNTPYWDVFNPTNDLTIEDTRILMYRQLPVSKAAFELTAKNGLLHKVEIYFKDQTTEIDPQEVAVKKSDDDDDAWRDENKGEDDKSKEVEKVKVNTYSLQLRSMLIEQFGEPEDYFNGGLIWKDGTRWYSLYLTSDSYQAALTITFNVNGEDGYFNY